MTKPWRPEGWGNPHKTPEGLINDISDFEYRIFEAGADAMLEAVKKKGQYIDVSEYPLGGLVLNDPCRVYAIQGSFKGWMLFIPDEEN